MGATVIAGELNQRLSLQTASRLPGGYIDDYEGPIYEFSAAGAVTPFAPAPAPQN